MNRIQKGFTLVELIIVIAVIGILAGTVIVNVGGVRENANTQSAISEMVQARTLIEDSYNPDTGVYGATTADVDEFQALDENIDDRTTEGGPAGTAYAAGTTRPGDWAYAAILLNDDGTPEVYCIDSTGANEWTGTNSMPGTMPTDCSSI